jgi:hypothetical protein
MEEEYETPDVSVVGMTQSLFNKKASATNLRIFDIPFQPEDEERTRPNKNSRSSLKIVTLKEHIRS